VRSTLTGNRIGHVLLQVMLNMYAAWIEGATKDDIEAIEQAMTTSPAARAAARRMKTAEVIPLKTAEFGNSLATAKPENDVSAWKPCKNRWRRGWDSNPRAGFTRPSDFESAPL
jgi:hypothetical protein